MHMPYYGIWVLMQAKFFFKRYSHSCPLEDNAPGITTKPKEESLGGVEQRRPHPSEWEALTRLEPVQSLKPILTAQTSWTRGKKIQTISMVTRRRKTLLQKTSQKWWLQVTAISSPSINHEKQNRLFLSYWRFSLKLEEGVVLASLDNIWRLYENDT